MAGFSTATNIDLIRTNLWSREIKDLLLDDLMGTKFVRFLQDFPDGTTINIPSIGEAESADFTEGQAIKYNSLDTGNFTFTFDQYKYSAHSITEKFKRDSYYSQDVVAAFVPREHRALMEAIETRILGSVTPSRTGGQTVSDLNNINSQPHRWVTSGTNQAITVQDFAKANHSLRRANVPMRNLVAIVDPSVAYTLMTQTNIVNLITPQPMWGDVVKSGLVTGMTFKFTLFDFDVYVSNYLPLAGNTNGGTETINSVTATTYGVCNLFFSAAPGNTLPIIGGFRQMPTVYHEFNKDLQQDEYVTICEYGFKIFRPENMVVVITSTNVIS